MFTPQDKEFFSHLSQSETGRYFASYVKKVIDYVHDSRNWSDGDSKESARQAATALEKHFLSHLVRGTSEDSTQNPYE